MLGRENVRRMQRARSGASVPRHFIASLMPDVEYEEKATSESGDTSSEVKGLKDAREFAGGLDRECRRGGVRLHLPRDAREARPGESVTPCMSPLAQHSTPFSSVLLKVPSGCWVLPCAQGLPLRHALEEQGFEPQRDRLEVASAGARESAQRRRALGRERLHQAARLPAGSPKRSSDCFRLSREFSHP